MSYQRKQAFVVPSWQTRDAPATQVSLDPPNEEWRDKAYTLHAAKKRATTSFSRVANQPKDYRAQEAWAEEERAVLRARAGLLDTLMGGHEDPKLCLPAQQSPNRVCVTYNRVRCEADGQVLLGPMQSTLSWVVHGGEAAMQGLALSDGPSSLGLLLGAIRRSMPPGKEALKALDRALRLPLPDRLETRPPASPDQTRAMQGGAFHVAWGALDLDVQEPWQNPSTNAAIRKSILQTAHEAMREAVRARKPLWSAANHLTVRIVHDDESHNLTLAPFCDSEACTVTHMQFVQSVFDQSGPERGILNLGQDPEATHAIPLGRITPIEGYVCLKAHRQTRLTEVQLNYVHSRGLLKHKGFDTSLLPAPEGLFLGKGLGGNSMPPTKSTRLSGTGVDVLASSYHLADQVYTTITVVRYPPFGTQFGGRPACSSSYTRSRLSMPRSQANDDLGSDEDGEPDKDWADYDDDYDDVDVKPKREPLRPDETPSYLIPHEYLPNIDALGKPRARKNNWKIELRSGEHYFVDGVCGDPTELKNRFIWFEVDGGDRYKQAQQTYYDIKERIRDQQIDWNKVESFYWNLYHNQNVGKEGYTAGQDWNHYWKQFISHHARQNWSEWAQTHNINAFWYVADTSLWNQILPPDDAIRCIELQKLGMRELKERHQIPEHDVIKSRLSSRSTKNQPKSKRTLNSMSIRIPAPLQRLPAPPAKATQEAVRTLQSRICALETKLEKANNNRNTQALLEKVLERLEETD